MQFVLAILYSKLNESSVFQFATSGNNITTRVLKTPFAGNVFSVLAVAWLLMYRDVYLLIFSIAFTCKPGSAKLKRNSAA